MVLLGIYISCSTLKTFIAEDELLLQQSIVTYLEKVEMFVEMALQLLIEAFTRQVFAYIDYDINLYTCISYLVHRKWLGVLYTAKNKKRKSGTE